MASATKATVLRPRHVVWGCLWLAVFVLGGVAQTHLRFAERDLEIQARRAQEALVSLGDDRAELEAEVEALRGARVIRERAVEELGLVSAPPTVIHRLEIREEDWSKYAGTQEEASLQRRASMEDPAWLRWISQTGWVGSEENRLP